MQIAKKIYVRTVTNNSTGGVMEEGMLTQVTLETDDWRRVTKCRRN
jgi:hypothetical protein